MTSSRPRFDSSRAWAQAMAAIRANREVVIAVAGVFFLLPSLVLSLLFPQPEPVSGASEAAIMAQAAAYYRQALPIALPMAVMQAAGTLGLLTLLTDSRRPTVAEAIRAGFGALLPYLASQIILGMGIGMLLLIATGMLAALAIPALTVAVDLAMVIIGAAVIVRFALTAPVVAIEKWRNPLAALRRAWQITAGNTWRILAFLALIMLAFVIILSVTMGLSGILLALLLPAKFAAMISAILSSALGAGMVIVVVACLAATHAQLAGEHGDGIGTEFD